MALILFIVASLVLFLGEFGPVIWGCLTAFLAVLTITFFYLGVRVLAWISGIATFFMLICMAR